MRFRSVALAGALLGAAVAFMGCEWSGGGSGGDFNTSRAGLDVNVSGVYSGLLSGGKAVDPKNGAPVFRFTVLQNGNTVEVTDSNGQQYRGRVGAPGAVFTGTTDIPAGTLLASYQVSFSGKDGVAGLDVNFVGVIDVVAVDSIRGDSTVTTINNTRSNTQTTDTTGGTTGGGSTTTETTTTITTTGSDSTGGENTSTDPGSGDVTDTGSAGNTTTDGTQTTTTTTSSNSGSDNSSATTGNNTTGSSQDVTRTIETTFLLTEGNSQFRLSGTWVEQGGFVGNVSARSAGSGRLVGGVTEGVSGEPAVDPDAGN